MYRAVAGCGRVKGGADRSGGWRGGLASSGPLPPNGRVVPFREASMAKKARKKKARKKSAANHGKRPNS
ncbi:hypothetical protein GCM10009779_54300 [Polymorphospora rubra]|uniref:Uncharacterized protein n=1 Tax=Polymorphospora rubra TaxID=338584 RepID=A0A810MZ25_9ACTN|nr:hypothetical protein Prubr_35520 [Polymorphospora rubra]